jgi:LytS/YehU family sensor histidine kinase
LKASEIVAIKAQMNPHFIFNALNSIQDLVLQKEIWNSSTYLGMFSDLLRMVLEVSGEDFVKLKTETAILETYLNLEKLRFSDGFTFRIESGKVYTDHESLYIPSMIIQPYVENAIKHGLLHKHGLKNINIEFLETDQTLQCFVTDNGVGRQKAQEIKERRSKSYKAFATEANRRRVDLFNEIYDEKIKLHVYDLFEDSTPSGTRVVLTFPRRLL